MASAAAATPPSPAIESFRREHEDIRKSLSRLDAVTDPSILKADLSQLGKVVLRHLDRKDRLYEIVAEACRKRGDAAGATLLPIFEKNMRVLSHGIRGFFEGLDAMDAGPQLAQRFKTVEQVLRNRLDTEEKAVLPIFARNPEALT